jgi:hypothetical protein
MDTDEELTFLGKREDKKEKYAMKPSESNMALSQRVTQNWTNKLEKSF